MANEKRLIDANALIKKFDSHRTFGFVKEDILPIERARINAITNCIVDVYNAPRVDAVEVIRIDEVKREMLQTLDALIATHRDISNSQFSDYEKCLDIPKSSNDYYGIYADTMEIARRLVNAALTDLCDNCGAKMDGERKEGE